MNEDQIENLLRKAPEARPPADLLGRLQRTISLPESSAPARSELAPTHASWLRAWLPNLGFATGLLACVALLAYQGNQLSELRQESRQLPEVAADLETLRREVAAQAQAQPSAAEQARLVRDRQELEQLRSEVAQLQAALAAASNNNNNKSPGTAAAASQYPAVAPETDDEFFARMGDPGEKAQSIQCINNLKQIGLAARIWATDNNNDVLPPSWLAMTNELSTPKILVCPSDQGRTPAKNWASFSAANVSYNYLNPNGSEAIPQVVLAQCPIHLHVLLSDGSVQGGQSLGKFYTLVQKDGKTVFQSLQAPQATMDAVMRKRYGLEPNTDPKTESQDELRKRYGLQPQDAPKFE